MIYFASDHGGFELKNKLITFLQSENLEIKDFGPKSFEKGDDYPDYVIPVMKELQQNSNDVAIILCRNGVGVSILANKFKNIRCALCFNPKQAQKAKTDDNANVLALPTDYISETEAKQIVSAWLSAEFSNEKRHIRRLNKVAQILN